MEINERWWMVELKLLIQSASDKIFNGIKINVLCHTISKIFLRINQITLFFLTLDMKLSFHEDQLLRLMGTIQNQFLSPPQKPIHERITSSMKLPVNAETSSDTASPQIAKFCPLINLYEYLRILFHFTLKRNYICL